jgi:hypothetical protein
MRTVARVAAHILTVSNTDLLRVDRIYFGRPRELKPHKLHRAPYLTIECTQWMRSEERAEVEVLARSRPAMLHRKLCESFSLTDVDNLMLYPMPQYPMLDQQSIPFLADRWLEAYRYGLRFYKRRSTGRFVRDKNQLYNYGVDGARRLDMQER